MKKITQASLIDTSEFLLYEILRELKEINQKLGNNTKEIKEEIKPKVKIENKIECKYCGETHSNNGEFLVCSRKNKKEGVSL